MRTKPIKNFLSLLLTLLLLLPGSASPAYAEGADFGVFKDHILDLKQESFKAVSYQDMVTNFFAKDPGAGEEWYVMTLVQTRDDINYKVYRTALGEYIKTANIPGATQRQKDALTYLAVGGDMEVIKTVVDDTVGTQGIMSYIYGLHLLNNGAPSELYKADDVVNTILDLRNVSGGWALSGDSLDVDTSAMAVQALAPYYSKRDDVREAVDKVLDAIGAIQLENGTFESYGYENPEGNAQVLLAFACLGLDGTKDERFIKNGNTLLDALMHFRNKDGSFSHSKDGVYNQITTSQVMYSSAAYSMMKANEGSFFIFDQLKEAETDSAIDIIHKDPAKKIDIKLLLYIAVTAACAIWAVVLIIKKRKKFNSYLSVILVLAASLFLIHSTNIEKPSDYYSDDYEITGETIECDLAIYCTSVAGRKDFIPENGVILERTTITIGEGMTAFDQLVIAARTRKIQLDFRTDYVSGINYIYEKDFGDLSGWMYNVNGKSAPVGASSMKLKAGDFVEWYYTVDYQTDPNNTN